jgi:hypothetical protein
VRYSGDGSIHAVQWRPWHAPMIGIPFSEGGYSMTAALSHFIAGKQVSGSSDRWADEGYSAAA